MSRAQRLLDLIQLLRRHRRPVSGQVLAAELSISLRTLYRDIDALKAQGAAIEGEPGLGYVLKPGFMLPPLMFSEEEIEALVLGFRFVSERADVSLAAAAINALAKIAAVLPRDLRDGLETSGLIVPPGAPVPMGGVSLVQIRAAIRREAVAAIVYADQNGTTTERDIWPFGVAFFDSARVLVAWCLLGNDYRHFRVDRILAFEVRPQRYPRRRGALLKEWRATLAPKRGVGVVSEQVRGVVETVE